MGAMDLGALLIAAALFAKSGLLGDALPGAPPPTDDKYGLDEPGTLSFDQWQKQIEPGGSYNDYQDYLKGV